MWGTGYMFSSNMIHYINNSNVYMSWNAVSTAYQICLMSIMQYLNSHIDIIFTIPLKIININFELEQYGPTILELDGSIICCV